MSRYAKALVAVAALLAAVGQALVDGQVSPQEWGLIAAAAGGAVGVWAVPNKPPE